MFSHAQGWVECVGCADRSCFDLSHHSASTKVDLSAKEDLPQPVSLLPPQCFYILLICSTRYLSCTWLSYLNSVHVQVTVDVVEIVPEKGIIGKKYRKDAKVLLDWLAGLSKSNIEQLEKQISDGG